MPRCPHCSKEIASRPGLSKHLTGLRRYGGHEVQQMEAEGIAEQVFAGSYRPQVSSLPSELAVPTYSAEVSADPYASFLIRFFETLVAHKRLPKYQFERRVDAIMAIFLPAILQELRGWKVDLVCPEFPLKKPSNNQSTNADHLLFRHVDSNGTAEAWILFELKTDDASCNDLQLNTYLTALDRGMPQLLADLYSISGASNARTKYAELRSCISRFPADRPIELVYLSPCRSSIKDTRVTALTFEDLEDLSIGEFPRVWDLLRTIMLARM
jgi:hypothetical protein